MSPNSGWLVESLSTKSLASERVNFKLRLQYCILVNLLLKIKYTSVNRTIHRHVEYIYHKQLHLRILFLNRSITISSVAFLALDSECFTDSEPGDKPIASSFAFLKASASACSVDNGR